MGGLGVASMSIPGGAHSGSEKLEPGILALLSSTTASLLYNN